MIVFFFSVSFCFVSLIGDVIVEGMKTFFHLTSDILIRLSICQTMFLFLEWCIPIYVWLTGASLSDLKEIPKYFYDKLILNYTIIFNLWLKFLNGNSVLSEYDISRMYDMHECMMYDKIKKC